jgi:DNA-binding NtrC family response regulator
MPRLWIVHRDPRVRSALSRLAAAPHDALQGSPADPAFAAAEPPDVVLLGLDAPFETELEFAHRQGARLPHAAWILLAERAELAQARRLFDALDAELLAHPPDPGVLRRRVRELARRARVQPIPLSQRAARDALAGRFARWFGDLELPTLLRALDPRLEGVPVLVRGEPGTGRGSLARYVHAFGGVAPGALLQVACSAGESAGALREAIAAAARDALPAPATGVCLLDVDRLAPPAQRELVDWIELGPPPGLLRASAPRWLATASEDRDGDDLDPALRQALGGLVLRIPPLRERAARIPTLVNELATRFATAHGERPRAFDDEAVRALVEYPWPGNLRELEAVIVQSLAASAADPLGAADLESDGEAFAPVDVEAIGAELLTAKEAEPAPAATPAAPERPALRGLPGPAAPAAPPEPAAPEPAAPGPGTPRAPSAAALAPLAAALAHELRGPLTGIRTFAELLAEQWTDPEFRARFAERTTQDVRRIEESLARLSRVAAFEKPQAETIDVTALLGELLEAQRERIRERRLLVLQELDTQHPQALGDPEQIRFALEALLDGCFALVPERGDLYLASKHAPDGLRGRPSLRVLARFHGPPRGPVASRVPGVTPLENSLALVLAGLAVRAQQGTLTLSESPGDEILVVLDLPAPA